MGISLSPEQIIVLVALMLLTAATMTSLGVLVAARMHSMEGFHMIMNFLLMPMFFLSGAFFPVRGDVPLWIEWLAKVDPMTYGVDPIRQVALQGSIPESVINTIRLHPIATDVTILAAFWLAMLMPAVWMFGRQE